MEYGVIIRGRMFDVNDELKLVIVIFKWYGFLFLFLFCGLCYVNGVDKWDVVFIEV